MNNKHPLNTNIMIIGLIFKNLIITNGIIFCTVKIKYILILPIVGSILINHLCIGGSPSLNRIIKVIKVTPTLNSPNKNKPNTNKRDATLWEMKYFTLVRILSSVML
jgi:hypothetical protein